MLRPRDPCETYRRIDFEARVSGSDPLQLVDVCFEQLCGSLDRALFAGAVLCTACHSTLSRAVVRYDSCTHAKPTGRNINRALHGQRLKPCNHQRLAACCVSVCSTRASSVRGAWRSGC